MAKTADLVKETITYVPGDGDPATVKWGGHTFHANVAKDIAGHPEGNEREQLNHQLIESAKNNPSFRVSGAPAARKGRNAVPKTAEEYRAHVAKWLQDPAIQHADELIARWAKERDLQAACEVGSDDYSFIGSLFMPKLHELAKGDELQPEQVAGLWINHGINQLPW